MTFLLEKSVHYIAVYLLFFCLIPVVLFVVQGFSTYSEGGHERFVRFIKNPTLILEINNSFRSIVVFGFLAALNQYLAKEEVFVILLSDDVDSFYNLLTFLSMIVVHDLYFYLCHRIMHLKWFFSVFHAVHHRSIETNPISAYNFSMWEALVNGLFTLLWLIFVPVTQEVLHGFFIFTLLFNALGHSKIVGIYRFRGKWCLDYLISPANHQLHHLDSNCNFAPTFKFWDRVFGTLNETEN